jgi:hypothetical protein
VELLRKVAPEAQIAISGEALPFPMALSDQPVRAFLGDYGSVPLEQGIRETYDVFRKLLEKGLLSAESIA